MKLLGKLGRLLTVLIVAFAIIISTQTIYADEIAYPSQDNDQSEAFAEEDWTSETDDIEITEDENESDTEEQVSAFALGSGNPAPSEGIVLQVGDSGEEVFQLQTRLAELNFLRVKPDGSFGKNTEEAIRVFELFNGLFLDGKADQADIQLINSPNAENLRTLSYGQNNTAIANIQTTLQELGYLPNDYECRGSFDNYTKAAVALFQAQNGLRNPDGIIGAWTSRTLSVNPIGMSEMRNGMRGTDVFAAQDLLRKYSYLSVSSDGIFGAKTKQAVASFQLFHDLDITGTIDLDTALILFGNSPSKYSMLPPGASGPAVLAIQKKLQALGYLPDAIVPDGSYGNATKTAMFLFQAYNGLLAPDGILGNWSVAKLTNSPIAFYPLEKGISGTAVKVMQTLLKSQGYLTVNPDGIYGSNSEASVKIFQLYNGQDITGIADLELLSLLCGNGSVVKFYNLSMGKTGTVVERFQQILFDKNYLIPQPDGSFGEYSKAAVIALQADKGIASPDGICGVKTFTLMFNSDTDYSEMRNGSKGNNVKVLQSYLKNYNYLNATVDGDFGGKTEASLKLFQELFGLSVTGTASKETLQILYNYGARSANAGWHEYNNTRYYINSSGALQIGWATIDGTRYYFTHDGLTYTGLAKDGQYYCYVKEGVFDPSYNGTATINGYSKSFQVVNGKVSAYLVPPTAALAQKADSILKSLGITSWKEGNDINALRKAFNWCVMTYQTYTTGGNYGTAYYANYGMNNHRGNCYCMAAAFVVLARELGYEAYQMSGYIASTYIHSWCEVKVNGQYYVFDPDFVVDQGGNGFQINYGQKGTWRYTDYYRMGD